MTSKKQPVVCRGSEKQGVRNASNVGSLAHPLPEAADRGLDRAAVSMGMKRRADGDQTLCLEAALEPVRENAG